MGRQRRNFGPVERIGHDVRTYGFCSSDLNSTRATPNSILRLSTTNISAFCGFKQIALTFTDFTPIFRTFIQTSIKEFFGVYRPFFLDACQPDIFQLDRIRSSLYAGIPSDIIWVPVTICMSRPKIIKNALQSYPSGHTGTAFTVMTFLSLYLNAKLKAFADFNTGFWKMIIVVSPVIAAVFLSATLYIDGVSSD